MSLKNYIDKTAYSQAKKLYQNYAYLNAQNKNSGGLGRVTAFVDGQYKVTMSNGTIKLIDPSGVRGMGPDGIILISGDTQIL